MVDFWVLEANLHQNVVNLLQEDYQRYAKNAEY